MDYFSRYLFAHTTRRNTGAAVVEFVKKIANVFGWSLAFYVDNGSHFVKGDFPKLLELVETKLFTAPIINPRSVGLAEGYVQLILAGLRVKVKANARPDSLEQWDEHLKEVVHAINTQILQVHGFSSSQLFISFNVRLYPEGQTAVKQI